MNIGMFLSIVSFALSLVGLIPIFFLKKQKKIVALTVIVSALLVTTGVVLFRVLQHEKLITNVQTEIRTVLSGKTKTFDQLYLELHYREYPIVTEALFREVEKGSLGQKTIYFHQEGESIPVKTYFVKH